MKYLITLLAVITFLFATAKAEAVRVRGYYKQSGTYVQPHFRTSPDSYKWNNYSYRGY